MDCLERLRLLWVMFFLLSGTIRVIPANAGRKEGKNERISKVSGVTVGWKRREDRFFAFSVVYHTYINIISTIYTFFPLHTGRVSYNARFSIWRHVPSLGFDNNRL